MAAAASETPLPASKVTTLSRNAALVNGLGRNAVGSSVHATGSINPSLITKSKGHPDTNSTRISGHSRRMRWATATPLSPPARVASTTRTSKSEYATHCVIASQPHVSETAEKPERSKVARPRLDRLPLTTACSRRVSREYDRRIPPAGPRLDRPPLTADCPAAGAPVQCNRRLPPAGRHCDPLPLTAGCPAVSGRVPARCSRTAPRTGSAAAPRG